MSLISGILEKFDIKASLAQSDHFEKWLVNEAWNKYNEYQMNKRVVIENEVGALGIKLPNGTMCKDYYYQFKISSKLVDDFWVEGLEAHNLKCELADDNETCTISGKPTESGDFTVSLLYKYKGWIEGEAISEIKLPIAFNPDPRLLWKNIETSKNIPFYKADFDTEYIKVEAVGASGHRKDIVAASQRGRSHAQEGKPRDDHFQLYHCDESDWYIVVVADGAGSAKYSRQGSKIACETVVKHCKEQLLCNADFEEKIRAYKNAEDKEDARKQMGNIIYNIVGNAAFKAHRAIDDASKANEGTTPKDFATTLLFAICKKIDSSWFVASYWVGDGAMCIFNAEKKSIKLLGIPDEGEYSGQTRFLTMPEIFKDAKAVFDRLRFSIEDDFTALLLMTDGVSDPMFETENNLNSFDKWNRFWETLKKGFPEDGIAGVNLSDDNEDAQKQLLKWLDFWSPGNHDDRTIAILY